VFYDETPLESLPVTEKVITETNCISETDSFKPKSLWQINVPISQPWKFSMGTTVTKEPANLDQEFQHYQNQILKMKKSIVKLEKASLLEP
jgi:hypothetical protein